MSVALAVALGLQLEPGAVRVEAKGAPDQDTTELRGAVARRLLEDGWTLVGGDQAGGALVTLRLLRDGVLIVIRDGGVERASEVPGARADLLRLEVAHRVQTMLEGVAATPPDLPRAAVGFRGRPPTDAEIRAATAPLLEAGFLVVAEQVQADWGVCITFEASSYTVQRGGTPPCEDPSGPTEAGDALYPLVAGQARELAADQEAKETAQLEALAASVSEDQPQPDPQPRPKPRPGPVPEPASRPRADAADTRRRGWGSVALAGGVQGRAFESEATAALRIGGGAGLWGGAFQLSFSPSFAGPLQVLDTFIAVGPAIRGRVAERVVLTAGVLGGVLIHRFVYRDSVPTERFDAQFVVPMSASIQLVGGFGLLLGVHAGASTRSRSHIASGLPLWRRDRFRWGLTAGLELAFGPEGKARR